TYPSVGSISRKSIRPVVDLPQPDSPTKPSVSPFCNVSETPSTALTAPIFRPNIPPVIGKYFFKLLASSSVSLIHESPPCLDHEENSVRGVHFLFPVV